MKSSCRFFSVLAIAAVTLSWASPTLANEPQVIDSVGTKNFEFSADENQNLSFNVWASDPAGTTPMLTAEDIPSNAIFTHHGDGTGTFSFAPDNEQDEVDHVSFIASDGALADTEIATITANSTNLDPVLNPIGNWELTAGFNLNFDVSAYDPDGTTPSLSVQNLPAHATFVDHGDGTGTFDFNPVEGATHKVVFRACDGSICDQEEVTIVVHEDPGIQDSVTIDVDNAVIHGNDSVVVAVLVFFDVDSISQATIPVYWEPNDYWVYDTAYFISERWTGPGKPDQLFLRHDTLHTMDSSGLMISWFSFFSGPQPGEDTIVTIHFHRNPSQSNPPGLFRMSFLDWFPTDNGFRFFSYPSGSEWTPAGKFVNGVDSIPVPAPPMWDPIAPKEVDEGERLLFDVSASDPNGDALTLTLEDAPGTVDFTDNGDGTGSFDWTPGFTEAGLYNVRFIASDASDDSLADTLIVEIAVLEAGGILETIEDGMPTEYALGQNYPNPFNASTNIKFVLRQGGHARLEVFNILGQKIATLVDEYLPAGPKLTRWDGTNATGTVVGSGFYFYRLAAGEYVEMRKMILMK